MPRPSRSVFDQLRPNGIGHSTKLNEEGVIPVRSMPEAFDEHVRVELARWAKVVEVARIELE